METFDHPISRSYGLLKSKGNEICIFPSHEVGDFKCKVTFPFVQFLTKNSFELTVIGFEEILEQQLHECTRAFHPFISIIVSIVQFGGIIDTLNKFFHDEG